MTTALIDNGVVQAGWDVLVEKLGIQKATEFVILLERGKGDSVQEISDYWGDATLAEIHSKVMAWKSTQR
jgi:hypothetical protein